MMLQNVWQNFNVLSQYKLFTNPISVPLFPRRCDKTFRKPQINDLDADKVYNYLQT